MIRSDAWRIMVGFANDIQILIRDGWTIDFNVDDSSFHSHELMTFVRNGDRVDVRTLDEFIGFFATQAH